MIYILIFVFIITMFCKIYSIKEGFSGFHEVNTILRFFYRCSDAIASAKTGIGNVFDKISPRSNGDKCMHHYQCKDKCICENQNNKKENAKDLKKECKCIPKYE